MATYQSVFKRCEKKYLITQEQYNRLSVVLRPRIERDEFAESTISNIYYDTPNFQLIRASLAKPAYKEKLRLRTYHTPSADTEAFVEIKKKFNHVVYKRRIGMSYQQAVAYLNNAPAPQESQISHEIDWFLRFYQGLRPAMCICYDRLAVFDREQPELRITFDTNIRWRTEQLDLAAGPYGEQLIPEDSCLMEIKIPGATPLWLAHTLSEIGIFSTSFSKYGTAFQTLLQRSLPARQSYAVSDMTQPQPIAHQAGGVCCG